MINRMINSFFQFFQHQPTSVEIPAYVPYYEISDKKGNLIGCITGTLHQLPADPQFEPAPRMQKCFDRATTLFVEADHGAVENLMRQELLRTGMTEQSINDLIQQSSREEHSLEQKWEKQAEIQGKPIKGLESPHDAIKTACKIIAEEAITPYEQRERCAIWTHEFLNGSDVKTKDYFYHCFINQKKTVPEFFTRNQIMARRINQALKTGDIPFVAIGYGHCLERIGVPQILKEQYDWDVREVKPYPPSTMRVPR